MFGNEAQIINVRFPGTGNLLNYIDSIDDEYQRNILDEYTCHRNRFGFELFFPVLTYFHNTIRRLTLRSLIPFVFRIIRPLYIAADFLAALLPEGLSNFEFVRRLDLLIPRLHRILNWVPGYYCNDWSLQWRRNERDGLSNHQPHDCLLNRLFRRRSKKTTKLRVTGLCEGNSPVTGEFSSQRASNVENISILWRHHVYLYLDGVLHK